MQCEGLRNKKRRKLNLRKVCFLRLPFSENGGMSEHLEEEVECGVADGDVLGITDDGVVGVADGAVGTDTTQNGVVAVAHSAVGLDGSKGGVVAVAHGVAVESGHEVVVGVADVAIAVDACHETATAVAYFATAADGGQGAVVAVSDGLGRGHGARAQQQHHPKENVFHLFITCFLPFCI